MDENVSFPPNFGCDTDFDRFEIDGFGIRVDDPSVDLNFASSISSEIESPTDDGDFSETVLKYINQMLMEEDMDAKPCMFHDPLALQAAEQSLYEVLGEKYPPSPDEHPLSSTDQSVESPDDSLWSNVADSSANVSFSPGNGAAISVNSSLSSIDPVEYKHSAWQNPLPDNFVFQSSAQSLSNASEKFTSNSGNIMGGFKVSDLLIPDSINENELMLQFKRGLEEGSKFLPKGDQLVINLEDKKISTEGKVKVLDVPIKAEKYEREHSPSGSSERKNHEREETDFEDGRSNKQLAVYTDETDLSELFDKVLLCNRWKENSPCGTIDEVDQNFETNKSPLQAGRSNRMSSVKARAKMQDNKKDVVDLRTLLISCAQAVSASDFRTANELLKQIRQHSSPFGDGSQRMAHYFANGLEARLAGTGSEIYASIASKRISATDMLKAYQAYLAACPFKKISIIFANRMIGNVAEKAEKLHIIDFGILYGFQWPAFIHCLSRRSGGPPKLRITGIELPQQGFRPEERVQETGQRLAKYCERYGVPFEFNSIAKKFENVQIEDFKIDRDEVLAVNCLFRFKNLLDETVIVNCPRNSVLNLIRKLNPSIFVHSIISGCYNAPFFVTRFREALFHFSSFFDVADANFCSEDAARLMFEQEFLGREVINVIACEGSERVERPETYKQWQVRTMRARFRSLPLGTEVMKRLKAKVKNGYHSDFAVEEDGNWLLQGWKGRVLYASSAWVPA